MRLRSRLVSALLLDAEGSSLGHRKADLHVIVVRSKITSVKDLSQGKKALKIILEFDYRRLKEEDEIEILMLLNTFP